MSQQFQPPAPSSYTPAPDQAPARTGNVGLGILAAVVAALVAAGVYGAIMNAIERQIGYAAVGVGLLVGLAAGKLGGRNPVLPVVGAVLSIGAVYLGQLFFLALALADYTHIGVVDVLSDPGIGGLNDIWKEAAEPMDYLFLAIGGFISFGAAKKAAA
ncbi:MULTISPECIES: hypothetical protein [unclassified Streptomyces]|uniref:hypothetical protein n=1 Tax=unclassified Streptomyces TaxID=2593676 RepID=UPI002E324D56|nr:MULTISPECIES: hypothetical protein [unclassified Streptomyces]WUC65035.1 hypothetical protein OG861_12735 [Streptomyces sp. NBC_00539]